MPSGIKVASLVPAGLVVEGVVHGEDAIVVAAHGAAATAACPLCGTLSRRVHSRYVRQVADLPWAGRGVRLELVVRRFACDLPRCRRRVFAERFGEAVLADRARRTGRLEGLVHHLGLALGGRPGAGFAQRLMLPVRDDAPLRVVRRRAQPRTAPLSVIGIDDWAVRRNHRYGSIVCDQERRRIVALLPDSETATAEAWLRQHPGVGVVTRDRGGGYGEAVARALPNVTQVADRWHLMENASAAFLDAVRRSMPAIRTVVGATTVDPTLLTAAERLQYEGYLRREEGTQQSLGLKAEGLSMEAIVRRTRYSRKVVRGAFRGARGDVCRVRQSSLELRLPALEAEWTGGCGSGSSGAVNAGGDFPRSAG